MAKNKSVEEVLPLGEEKCAELINAIANEERVDYSYSLKKSAIGREILNLDRHQQVDLAMAMVRCGCQPSQQTAKTSSRRVGGYGNVRDAMLQIVNRRLPFSESDVMEIVHAWEVNRWWYYALGQLVKVVENFTKENDISPELEMQILKTYSGLETSTTAEYRKYAARLKQLLPKGPAKIPLEIGEAWSDRAISTLEALPEETRDAWIQLLEECALVSGGKPTGKWLKAVKTHRDCIGREAFQKALCEWFPLVDLTNWQPSNRHSYHSVINERHADILKGLVWLCVDIFDPEIVRAIGQLTILAYKKIPGMGACCVRLGNACVWTLGQMDLPEAVSQLAFLTVKVKFGSAQIAIDKALTAAAHRLNVPRSEIEEMAVPAYGLEGVGIRRETLGDFTAELIISGTTSVELRWLKPDGNPQKSVPKDVKENHKDELKELKQAAKDIQRMLPAQRDRIENLYLQQKTWDYALWQDRYLDHPLVGTLTRRIIWEFQEGDRTAAAIWQAGNLVDRNGQTVDWLTNNTKVQLWHPIGNSTETILTWREFLSECEIRQPFKQAHRELYLLTAAEESTNVYSNRFAAHILKQHQFNALCTQRGWKNQLRLMVDDSYEPARRLLPEWGLRAEFWVEGIGEEYGTDTNDAGTYYYLTTDQVRFYAIDATANYSHAYGGGYEAYRDDPSQPIPLSEIPAFVLSEILRDVDLFVGVASVGNDPNWADGGPDTRHYNYWYGYSFGDLSETAKTRRQVLEHLLPRLKKIRDRCTLEDKFLIVRGELRTYKIHLGSGNILMEPNNQYLCIVPASGSALEKSTSSVFLPFEGDRMLAIVLSKAFMLAVDTKIADPSILSQISKPG